MSKSVKFFKAFAVLTILIMLLAQINTIVIVVVGLIFYFYRAISNWFFNLHNLPLSTMDKLYNETHSYTCTNCNNEGIYSNNTLFEQFGNCGGYEDGLFIECNKCRHVNKIYTNV